MLILFAIFADRAHQVGLADGTAPLQAQQAMAVFSFFLFVVYGFFGAVLGIFRNDVVKDGKKWWHSMNRSFIPTIIFHRTLLLHYLIFVIDFLLLSESLSSGDGGSYNDGENGQQNEEDAQEEYN